MTQRAGKGQGLSLRADLIRDNTSERRIALTQQPTQWLQQLLYPTALRVGTQSQLYYKLVCFCAIIRSCRIYFLMKKFVLTSRQL